MIISRKENFSNKSKRELYQVFARAGDSQLDELEN